MLPRRGGLLARSRCSPGSILQLAARACSSAATAPACNGSRRAKWESERSDLKLVNKGDTHYAADRRAYKQQLSELRSAWIMDDLHNRRAAYVAKRAAQQSQKASREAAGGVSASQAAYQERAMAKLAEAEQKEAIRLARKEEKLDQARKRALSNVQLRDDAEASARRQWLEELLRDFDVDGKSGTSSSLRSRSAWVHKDDLDKRLHVKLMNFRSPVGKWNDIARALQKGEEDQMTSERLSGRLIRCAPTFE